MRLAETKLGVLQAEQEIISSITPMPKPNPAPAAPAVDPLISPVVGAINPNTPTQDPGITITQPVIPETTPTPSPQPAPMTSQGNANFDQQLQALRAEREMLSRQFEHLNTGAAPDTLAQPAPGPPVIPRTEEANPNIGGPVDARPIASEEIEMEETAARVTPAEQRIIDAPALAKVANYNSDWQFIVHDGGSERNIRKGQKFAVRRGSEIVCTIQVSDVDVSSATADLLGRAKNDPKSPKPQQGDDVIGYPLF